MTLSSYRRCGSSNVVQIGKPKSGCHISYMNREEGRIPTGASISFTVILMDYYSLANAAIAALNQTSVKGAKKRKILVRHYEPRRQGDFRLRRVGDSIRVPPGMAGGETLVRGLVSNLWA